MTACSNTLWCTIVSWWVLDSRRVGVLFEGLAGAVLERRYSLVHGTRPAFSANNNVCRCVCLYVYTCYKYIYIYIYIYVCDDFGHLGGGLGIDEALYHSLHNLFFCPHITSFSTCS